MVDRVDIFNDCIDRLQTGQTINDCLRSYPAHAAWLRPRLEAGLAVARANPAVSAAAKARVRARVMEAAAVEPRRFFGARTRLLAASLLAAALGIIALLFWRPDEKRLHVVPLSPTIAETATPSPTASPAPTHTPSPTNTASPSPTSTSTHTPNPTHTPLPSLSRTSIPAPTHTYLPPQPIIAETHTSGDQMPVEEHLEPLISPATNMPSPVEEENTDSHSDHSEEDDEHSEEDDEHSEDG